MAKKSPKEGKDRKKSGRKSTKSGKSKKHKDHHKNKHRKTETADEEMPSMSANMFQMPPDGYQPSMADVSAYTATATASDGDRSSKKGSERGSKKGSERGSQKGSERGSKKGSERGSKKESALVFMAPTAYVDDIAADKGNDTSSTGRFCILMGALGIMAMTIYFVLHLYQWVGPAEMITVDSSTATPLAENTASSTSMSSLA